MSACLDAALEYIEQDFSIIPVERITKKPLISTWKEYQKRIPTADEVESWWEKWPDANVAIITGEISNLVVVDADGDIGSQWVNDHCQKTTVYVQTRENRFHAFYTYPYGTPIGNRVKFVPEVDIRGEGGYVVAPPSVHEFGHNYEFIFLGDGFDDLPEFEPLNGTAKAIDAAAGNLNINLSEIKSSPINKGVEKGSRNNTLASLAGQWFGKGLDYDEAEELAIAWNKKNSPPLGEKELRKTIRSIYKTHNENHPVISETPDLPHEKPTSDTAIEDDLLKPGGTLQRIMDFIESNSSASVPFFSLGSALTFLGAVLGQKVMTESGLRTNLYSISLGYSGSGKDAPMGTIPQLLMRSTAKEIQGPSELTSDAAILSWLADDTQLEHRNVFLCLDEIGQVLKGMKNPGSPQAGIPRLLTKLFSSTDRSESKAYADRKNNLFIPWHHVAMYGATTPERFWESITSGEVADGFLARILLFESLHNAPLPDYNVSFDVPQKLVDEISSFYTIPIKWRPPGNLNINKVPLPNIVPKSNEGMEVFQTFAIKYHDLKNEHKKNTLGLASIYGRAAEHASKIALIHAASTHGAMVKEVGVESVQWACSLVNHLVTHLIRQLEENISDTATGRLKQKIIKGIRAYSERNAKNEKRGYHGATLRDITRGPGQGYRSKEVNEILNTLLIEERIGKRMGTATNGNPIELYYVAKK